MRRRLEIRGRKKNPIHLAKVLSCVYKVTYKRRHVGWNRGCLMESRYSPWTERYASLSGKVKQHGYIKTISLTTEGM